MDELELNEQDLRLIIYALEHYSVGTDWSPMHKKQIVTVLERVKKIQEKI